MKCYKCHEEMSPICDTAWRIHKDGTKKRETEFLCTNCRVWIAVRVDDYSECNLLNEMLEKVKEYARDEE